MAGPNVSVVHCKYTTPLYLTKATSIDQTQLRSSVHHLDFWFAATRGDEDETQRIRRPTVVMSQAVAVRHIARQVGR